MSNRLEAAMAELIEALAEAVREEADARPAAPDRLLSVDEAGAMLGIGRSSVYAEIQAGRLRSIRVGRRRLIAAAAIAEFIVGGRAA
jgi:excisionase family DNA binding protein